MDNQDPKLLDEQKDGHIVPPDATFNGNYTAIPKDVTNPVLDPDQRTTGVEFGEMNEEDARESGYIADDGQPVDTAKDSQDTRH